MATEVSKAVDVLRDALNEDKEPGSYYYTWQANIAVQFQDEFHRAVDEDGLPCTPEHIWAISNRAAKNFLNCLIGKQNKELLPLTNCQISGWTPVRGDNACGGVEGHAGRSEYEV
jgi:hypothetical protein